MHQGSADCQIPVAVTRVASGAKRIAFISLCPLQVTKCTCLKSTWFNCKGLHPLIPTAIRMQDNGGTKSMYRTEKSNARFRLKSTMVCSDGRGLQVVGWRT